MWESRFASVPNKASARTPLKRRGGSGRYRQQLIRGQQNGCRRLRLRLNGH
jgi:hypothetical protein